jgi:hypothetical protein
MSTHRSVSLAVLGLAGICACTPAEHSTDPSSSELPFRSGALSGATSGRVSATQTTSGPGVTLTGLVGNFTRLSYHNGDPELPTVYFSGQPESDPIHLWRVNLDGTGLEELTHDTSESANPSIAPSGNRLLFWQLSGRTPFVANTWLSELEPGQTVRQLFLEVDGLTPPLWSADERSVMYSQNISGPTRVSRLVRLNLETLQKQTLLEDPNGNFLDETSAVVDGNPLLIFQVTDSFYQLYLATLTSTLYHRSGDPAVGLSHPRLSHDGERIMYWAGPANLHGPASAELRIGSPAHPETAHPILTLQNQGYPGPYDARWLVDGSGIVALLPQENTTVSQLYLLDTTGAILRQLTSLGAGIGHGYSIGPAGTGGTVTLVGDDGILGTSSSGIIFGQGSSGGVSSVVSFTSSRPHSVELKAETGLNSSAPVLTYTLRADRLEGLRYVNNPVNDTAVTVVDSTMSPVGGAVITFDAATGRVAVILPFAATTLISGSSPAAQSISMACDSPAMGARPCTSPRSGGGNCGGNRWTGRAHHGLCSPCPLVRSLPPAPSGFLMDRELWC